MTAGGLAVQRGGRMRSRPAALAVSDGVDWGRRRSSCDQLRTNGYPHRHSRESGNPPPALSSGRGKPGFWIPACAGMTVWGAARNSGGGRDKGWTDDGKGGGGRSLLNRREGIPAFAGMTVGAAGMTVGAAGMTVGAARMTAGRRRNLIDGAAMGMADGGGAWLMIFHWQLTIYAGWIAGRYGNIMGWRGVAAARSGGCSLVAKL